MIGQPLRDQRRGDTFPVIGLADRQAQKPFPLQRGNPAGMRLRICEVPCNFNILETPSHILDVVFILGRMLPQSGYFLSAFRASLTIVVGPFFQNPPKLLVFVGFISSIVKKRFNALKPPFPFVHRYFFVFFGESVRLFELLRAFFARGIQCSHQRTHHGVFNAVSDEDHAVVPEEIDRESARPPSQQVGPAEVGFSQDKLQVILAASQFAVQIRQSLKILPFGQWQCRSNMHGGWMIALLAQFLCRFLKQGIEIRGHQPAALFVEVRQSGQDEVFVVFVEWRGILCQAISYFFAHLLRFIAPCTRIFQYVQRLVVPAFAKSSPCQLRRGSGLTIAFRRQQVFENDLDEPLERRQPRGHGNARAAEEYDIAVFMRLQQFFWNQLNPMHFSTLACRTPQPPLSEISRGSSFAGVQRTMPAFFRARPAHAPQHRFAAAGLSGEGFCGSTALWRAPRRPGFGWAADPQNEAESTVESHFSLTLE